MGHPNNTKATSKQESARLYVGELEQLVEEAAFRNSMLRNDGREVLDHILACLEANCIGEDVSSNICTRERRRIFAETRRQIHANWMRVDALIDDLLSSAIDELSQFASETETRIGTLERILRHEESKKSSGDGTEPT
jgi:hypothetical protein